MTLRPQIEQAFDFPGGSDGKASAYNAGDPGSIPGPGRSPGEGSGSTPVLLPGKSHGRRSLVGYRPWGCEESATTERLHFPSLHATVLLSAIFLHRSDLCSGFSTSVAGRVVSLPKDVHVLIPGTYIYLLYMARGNVRSRRLLLS